MNNSNLSPATSLALLQASQTDTSGATRALQAAADKKKLEKAERAATDFEAMFISEMMKPMFEGIETEAPFGGGKGEEVFRGMLLQEYGKIIAQTGGIGISDQVKTQMLRMQEEQAGGTIAQTKTPALTDGALNVLPVLDAELTELTTQE